MVCHDRDRLVSSESSRNHDLVVLEPGVGDLGMLLVVPMMMVVKVVCDHVEGLLWLI